MASPIMSLFAFLIFIIFHLQATPAAGAVILEDGYTVSTVLVGDKSELRVNPESILPLSPPSELFILLDHAASTFYTVSMPAKSNEVKIQRLAGNGQSYIDGCLDSATFNKPKSFAVDFTGNIYVADQSNGVIRKISKTGVTTIAGGYSQKLSDAGGPAQNASFSKDFVLAFAPERCALLITDHNSRVVRQLSLKTADCMLQSGSVMGTKSFLLLFVVLSCIFGIIVGLLIRPYILPYEGTGTLHSHWTWTWTWTRCLSNLERRVAMLCSDFRSVIAKSAIFSLLQQVIMLCFSLLALMFKPAMPMPTSRTMQVKSVSLMDIDEVCSSISSSSISRDVDNQLKDLFSSGGGELLPVNTNAVAEEEVAGISSGKCKNVDDMILENLVSFEEKAPRVSSPDPLECRSGLFKRI